MPSLINNTYTITSSNGSTKQRPSVRVKRGGIVLAVIYSDHSQPLARLRRYMLCPERESLVSQLERCNVSQEDIAAILAMPK